MKKLSPSPDPKIMMKKNISILLHAHGK